MFLCVCVFGSSGTTQGRPKLVPFNEELVKSTMQIYRTSYAFRNKYGTHLFMIDCLIEFL